MTIIPKIAFTFWEGLQFTYLHALTIETFQKHNPDFRIIIYISYNKNNNLVMWSSNEQKKIYNNLYDINLLKNIPNVEFIEVDLNKILNYNGVLSSVWKSDIIRLMKLYEHGGMYIDFDILFIKKVPESLLKIDKIMFNTYKNIINNAVIISNKQNNILKILINEIMKIINNNDIKNSYMQFGPTLITRIIHNNENLQKDVYYIPNDMTCPYLWNQMDKLFLTNKDQTTKDTFCIHWYNGAPVSRDYCINFDIKKINKNNNIFEKILIESYK
jgi:mannosyltransferase OCH1-like enzyme